MEAFFQYMTQDGKSKISQTEWLCEFIDYSEALTPKRVRSIFRFFDHDGNQLISKKEMMNAFKKEDIKISF